MTIVIRYPRDQSGTSDVSQIKTWPKAQVQKQQAEQLFKGQMEEVWITWTVYVWKLFQAMETLYVQKRKFFNVLIGSSNLTEEKTVANRR